ncbi:MAG: PAS domain S-box protein [Spirochaetes bacterium]|nr:PAS domain S-box protein [Spirochaetota bacterium]MBN2771288.1 PAS domain S-box protein [Spirochaetota bacterium]
MNRIGKNILLVEDELVTATLEKSELEKYGYSVIHVADAIEAIKTALETDKHLDLILMDIDLGSGLDGTEAAEKIVKDKEIPIVFLSSHTEPSIVEKTEKITSYGYVVKNSGIVVLDASIKMAFKLFEAKCRLQVEIENHKRIEKELQESEERFKALHNASFGGIVIHDKGVIIDCNNGLSLMTGYTVDELIGMDGLLLIAEEDRDYVLNKIVTGYEQAYEAKGCRKDGEIFPMRLEARNVPYKGKMVRTVEFRDLTEVKNTEEALKLNELKWKSYIEYAPYAIFVSDKDGRYLDVNPMASKITGYSREELLSMTILDIVPINRKKEGYEHFKNVIKNGTYEKEVSFLAKNGEHRYWNVAAQKISDNIYLAYCNDTTENRKSHKQLQLSEERYRNLFTTMAQGVVYQDVNGAIISANPAAEEILGITIDQMKGVTSIDPRWQAVDENMNKLSGEEHPSMIALKTGKVIKNFIQGIYNPKRNDYVWIIVNSVPLFKEGEDKPYQVYSLFLDITERKHYEEALRQSEAYIKAIMDNLPIGIAINTVTPTVKFTYMNDNFPVFYHTTREKLFENNSFWETVYKDKKFRDKLQKQVEMDCASGDPTRMQWDDIPFISDGKTYYICARNIPLPNSSEMISTVWDATNRKETELELTRQLNEKEIILKEVNHRIKNNIRSIEAVLSLQIAEIKNPESKEIIADALRRIQSMRIIYDKLLLSRDYKNTSVKAYLEDLLSAITQVYSDRKNIKIITDIFDFNMNAKILFPLGSIINELVTNSIKHSFKTKNDGTIQVILIKKETLIELTVLNNGDRLPKDFDPERNSGFGLMLVKMLSQQLQGSFTIDNNDNGTISIVTFPCE